MCYSDGFHDRLATCSRLDGIIIDLDDDIFVSAGCQSHVRRRSARHQSRQKDHREHSSAHFGRRFEDLKLKAAPFFDVIQWPQPTAQHQISQP